MRLFSRPIPSDLALPLRGGAVGLVGLGVFAALGLPLPFLLGPMAAGLIAALSGVRFGGLGVVAAVLRTVLGVAVGASVTPELVGRLPGMAISVALVIPMVAIMGAVGVPYFRRVCGYGPVTSYYAAMPGGLQDMLAFGIEAGGNARTLSLVHATRVIAIVSAAPLLLGGLYDAPINRPAGLPASMIPVGEQAAMVVAALLGWWAAVRVRLFGAAILGPMILAAAARLTGLIDHRPPAEAIEAAQFVLGLGVAAQYARITLGELGRDVTAALGYCAILAAISLVFAEIAVLGGLAPAREAFLSFAPGGQAEMAVLAILAGADVAYVVTHHIVRLVVVILGAPLVAGWMRGTDDGRDPR